MTNTGCSFINEFQGIREFMHMTKEVLAASLLLVSLVSKESLHPLLKYSFHFPTILEPDEIKIKNFSEKVSQST